MKKVIVVRVSSRGLGLLGSGILCIALTLVCSIVGFMQPNSRINDYTPDKAIKSNARINPMTRAMELSIPIFGYQGRAGSGLPVTFDYSSKVWQIEFLYTWQTQAGDIKTDTMPRFGKTTSAGWTSSLGVPRIHYPHNLYKGFVPGATSEGPPYDPGECYFDCASENYQVFYVKRVEVVIADGSSVQFRKDDTTHYWGTAQGSGSSDMTGNFLSVDGSRMRLELTQNERTLFMPDGSRYLFGQGDLGTVFIDRHGNKMTFDAVNKRWTDTMGRAIDDPIPVTLNDFDQTQITVGDKLVSLPGKDGATFEVTLSWRYLKDPNGGESGLSNPAQELAYLSNQGCQGNLNRWLSTAEDPQPHLFKTGTLYQWDHFTRVCHPISWSGLDWWPGPRFNPKVVTKITLPNGQKYEFKYNIYGEIEKIIYPTGAYERFLYGEVPAVLPSMSGHYDQANRGVLERWVSEKGDGTDELHWEYDGWLAVAPDGTQTQQFFVTDSPYNDQPFGYGNPYLGKSYEDRILSPAPGNQLLRRKLTGYEKTGPQTGGHSAASRDTRPNKEISIIFEPGVNYALAQMTETTYDTHSDPQYFAQLNPKQVKTHSYVVLDLSTAQTANIDTIAALFSTATVATVTEMDYLYDANYKARNITGLVTETRVKDASGNVKATTQISYDDIGHTETSSGTMPTAALGSWVDPLTEHGSTLGAKRGLSTIVKSYYDIANGYYIQTESFYDQFGNLRKSRDGRGNDSWVNYDDEYAFAYPTSTVSPAPDSTGTHGSNTALTTSSTYDYNTALTLTVTDANGQTTEMEYADALLRPTKVTAPNDHETITEYGAGTSPSTRWVKVKSQIDETKWKEAISWFDGLGRTIKTQSIDSAGDVFVETQYDNMGRPNKVTNPYRNGETVYWTENTFDTAGRLWKVTTPDNAVVETTYGLTTAGSDIGTVVTVEDQADKQRRSITNALGQLKRVDEPNNAGQLGTVDNPNQWTGYSYDLLNNLITVNQGVQTRSFTYDALSRLRSATNPESGTIDYTYDANSNLLTKTDARDIVTTYAYDALDRVKTRVYTEEPSGSETPDVSYFYDNLTNAKGKLIKVSSSVSTTEYTAFDILGRVTAHKQTTDGNAYTTGYVYNLSGALIEETYPSGRVVKNVLDNNGDLSMVQSKKTASHGYWNYAENFTYTASGAVSSLQLGNGKWESTQFNSRLQPTQIALGQTQNATNLLKLDYSYGGVTNNGNVQSQTITVPTVGQNPGFTAIQTYTYDSLNRLKDAKEMSGTTETWKQTFVYDRYGNRNFDIANTTYPSSQGTLPKVVNPEVLPSSNRFKSDQDNDGVNDYLYDAVGSIVRDANGNRFSYDANNQQKEFYNLSNQTQIPNASYVYDGYGKRVKKVVGDETTIFVYDMSGELIAEYTVNVPPSEPPSVNYLTTDHLGSPRITTDENGNVVSRRDFMPFGEEVFTTQRTEGLGYTADDIRQKFTGYEKDEESGLDYAQARYFNGVHGRFTSVDPLMASASVYSPQTFNRYTYVSNNPLNDTDPTGTIAQSQGSDCPEGKICDENGKVVEFDSKGNIVAGSVAVVTVEAVKEAAKVVIREPKWWEMALYYLKQTPKGIVTIGKLGGAALTIILNPTSTGCGASPGMGSDGNGGCVRTSPKWDPTMSDEPTEPSEDNPKPDPAENDTPSDTKKKKDKKKEKQKKDTHKKLSPGEIEILKKNDIDPHELKKPYGKPAHYDLYKNHKGDIKVFRKGGGGEGIETGLNMNDYN